MSETISKLVRDIERYRLGARHPILATAWRLAQQGCLLESSARAYSKMLPQLIQEQIEKPNMLPRAPTQEELWADGPPDVQLGRLAENPEVRWGGRMLDRPRHGVVAGMTSAGKTTLLRQLVCAVDQLGKRTGKPVSIIVQDRKGGDFADLVERLGDNWVHASVHDAPLLALNAPAGVPDNVWINTVSAAFGVRAGLVASANSLANMMRWLREELKKAEPNATRPLWPNFDLLLDVLMGGPEDLWAGKAIYAGSLRQALEAVTRASGSLFHTFNGLDLERDIISQGKSLVIDMPNLQPASLRHFVTDLLMLQVLVGRVHRKHKVDTTEVLFVIDEADQDVSRKCEESFSDLSPISLTMKQGREMGVAVVVGLSLLGEASRYVLGNAQYYWMFAPSGAESISEAARTLVLPRGGERMLTDLKAGECLIRESLSAWSDTMKGVVDPFPPCRTAKTSGFDRIACLPSRRLADLPSVQRALDRLIDEHKQRGLKRAASKKKGLSQNAHKLLSLSSVHEYLPVARLWERIGRVSMGAQQAARNELVNAKLALFQEIRIARRNVLLIETTQKGRQFLGKPAPTRVGRGSIAHRHFAYWLMRVGQKSGFEAHREWQVPGSNHATDCAWKTDDGWACFEVAITCMNNLASHIQACLAPTAEVTRVTIVAAQLAIIDKIRRQLNADASLDALRDHVAYETIETYIAQLPELKP